MHSSIDNLFKLYILLPKTLSWDTHCWFNLTDSLGAVITIHNLNGKQAACPALGRYDLKVFRGDTEAGAQDQRALNSWNTHTTTHTCTLHTEGDSHVLLETIF